MKIRFKTSAAGADWTANAGADIELPDDEAARFVEAGLADAVELKRKATKQKYEKAVISEPEGA